MVDDVEGVERIFAQLLPDLTVLGIALLQQDELTPGRLAHGFVALRLELDLLVNFFEVPEGIALEQRGVALPLVAEQDHAETGAPIAEMIVGDDLMSQKAVDARERVAENGAAQMPDMHFLGNVGTAVNQ